jgi:DmsE family decaheme c-type cytochrome
MQDFRTLKQFEVGLVMVALLLLLSLTAIAESKQETQTPPPAPAAGSGGAQYVGEQVCQSCHEEIAKKFDASPHWMTTQKTKMTNGAHACESCHGPGSAHVEGGGDKTKIFNFVGAKPEAITERCMTCHGSSLEQQHFEQSVHNENGITCTNCHSIHHSQLEYLLVKKQTALCFSCHAEQRSDFQKPFRHRVEAGLIQCSDCHNAHGTTGMRQVRATPEQDFVCFKCHSDKRGPFVFEHEPVKVDGCGACHSPHGSTNPRMLNTARTNSLCLQCHAATDAIGHTQNTRLQQCIACHSNIHGSNLSNVFFK